MQISCWGLSSTCFLLIQSARLLMLIKAESLQIQQAVLPETSRVERLTTKAQEKVAIILSIIWTM